jgi:hypothetical protein
MTHGEIESLIESSLLDLYRTTGDAFPKTGLRQYATQPIKISRIRSTAYKGVKTLLIRGLAQNEGREYTVMMLFKGIEFKPEAGSKTATVEDPKLGHVHFIRPKSEKNDVAVRCDCQDFFWRWNWYDSKDGSLYGTKRGPYVRKTKTRPPANPKKLPGLCKHLIKFWQVLENLKLLDPGYKEPVGPR